MSLPEPLCFDTQWTFSVIQCFCQVISHTGGTGPCLWLSRWALSCAISRPTNLQRASCCRPDGCSRLGALCLMKGVILQEASQVQSPDLPHAIAPTKKIPPRSLLVVYGPRTPFRRLRTRFGSCGVGVVHLMKFGLARAGFQKTP